MTLERSSRAHILFVAPSAYTLSGLATWLDYLLPGLTVRNWRTTLGLVSGPRHHRPASYLSAHPCEHVVEVVNRSGTATGRRAILRQVVARLQPDLVVTVNIPDAIVAVQELRNWGKFRGRVAMTCHGIQHDLFADARLLAPAIDAAICTNRLAERLMIDYAGLAADQVRYAAYGTPLPQPKTRAANGSFTFAYSGRIEEDQKRISDVASIAGRLRAMAFPFRLLVAGSGPEEGAFRAALAQHGALGQVRFLGQVAPEELGQRVYSQVDAVLITSRWETGPIVAWEAMAHGAPVVSARYVGSGLEGALVHRENCLLFDIGDWQAAAAALAELDGDPRLAEQLVRGGRKLVATRYSTDASISQWHEVLSAMMSVPPRPPQALHVPQSVPGRLERWLGSRLAECIRERRGRLPADGGPGGEWPHTLSRVDHHDRQFWAESARLDRPDVSSAPSVLSTAIR